LLIIIPTSQGNEIPPFNLCRASNRRLNLTKCHIFLKRFE
jgi:hypothetical protein